MMNEHFEFRGEISAIRNTAVAEYDDFFNEIGNQNCDSAIFFVEKLKQILPALMAQTRAMKPLNPEGASLKKETLELLGKLTAFTQKDMKILVSGCRTRNYEAGYNDAMKRNNEIIVSALDKHLKVRETYLQKSIPQQMPQAQP